MNMNIRSIVLIVIALVVAGGAAMLARSLVSTPKQDGAGQQNITTVRESKMKILVAAVDLPVGHFIKANDMTWQSWPDEDVNKSYIQKDSGQESASFVGAVTKNTTYAGEPILEGRLAKPGNRGFMAAVLPEGKRAITIKITAISGNAGFVFPGDHVDILLTHEVAIKSPNRKKAHISETVLTNVRVLAINQKTDNPTNTPAVGKTATLEVTPKEAEKVALIKDMGELTLVLRSLENTAPQISAGRPTVTWDNEVSQQVSGGGGAASKGHNDPVEVFRGGVK